MFAMTAAPSGFWAQATQSPLESHNNHQRATSHKGTTIMTTSNGTPVEAASVALGDATSWAENIVHTAINMRAHTRLSGAALRLWEAAVPLFETERWSGQHRQAVKLSLDALIMQPEVLAWVARETRDHLAKVEAAETTPAPTKTSWLQHGQTALAVIRALEAGTPGDDTIAYVRTCGEKTMVLGHDGQLWTMDTDASASQAFREAEKRDAAEVRQLYHFFWPIAWAEMVELALKRGEHEKAEAAEGLDAGEVAPLEHTPLAVNHTIDGLICEVRPDGALDLSSSSLGLVKLEPRDAYALLMFFRSPAVVALLEAQNALRMTASEIGFQNDPETIAELAAQQQAA